MLLLLTRVPGTRPKCEPKPFEQTPSGFEGLRASVARIRTGTRLHLGCDGSDGELLGELVPGWCRAKRHQPGPSASFRPRRN
jgi:hypothetical protein